MNANNDLLFRLLKLFPVKLVKEHFDVPYIQQNLMLDGIIASKSAVSIRNFCLANINNTKQHIYVYSIDKPFLSKHFKKDEFHLNVEEVEETDDGVIITCVERIRFDVYLTEPTEKQHIDFFQPLKIVFTSKTLIIHATILERSMQYYVPTSRIVLNSKRRIDEEEMIGNIVSFFSKYRGIERCDLTTGVKALWDVNVIDAKYSAFRKSSSVSSESMDANSTLKQQYPDVYEEIKGMPLERTVFKYLGTNKVMCDHFTIEPMAGFISIPIYPTNQNQIPNVINKILQNN